MGSLVRFPLRLYQFGKSCSRKLRLPLHPLPPAAHEGWPSPRQAPATHRVIAVSSTAALGDALGSHRLPTQSPLTAAPNRALCISTASSPVGPKPGLMLPRTQPTRPVPQPVPGMASPPCSCSGHPYPRSLRPARQQDPASAFRAARVLLSRTAAPGPHTCHQHLDSLNSLPPGLAVCPPRCSLSSPASRTPQPQMSPQNCHDLTSALPTSSPRPQTRGPHSCLRAFAPAAPAAHAVLTPSSHRTPQAFTDTPPHAGLPAGRPQKDTQQGHWPGTPAVPGQTGREGAAMPLPRPPKTGSGVGISRGYRTLVMAQGEACPAEQHQ